MLLTKKIIQHVRVVESVTAKHILLLGILNCIEQTDNEIIDTAKRWSTMCLILLINVVFIILPDILWSYLCFSLFP